MYIFGFENCGGPDVQGFHRVPVPTVAPETIRIRVVAAGVNPADVKVRSGARQQGFPVVFPMAMGREACGEVLALRARAPEGIAVGDRVFGACAAGTGAIGEQALLAAASVVRLPDGLDSHRAAMAADGDLEIVLDDTVPFEEAGRAVARVEQGHARGKTVVTFT